MVTKVNGTTGVDRVATGAVMPTGSVIQVKSTLYSTATSESVTADTDNFLSSFNLSITPVSTSSKIMLFGRWVGELNAGGENDIMWFFGRNGSKINSAPTTGSRNSGMATHYINYWADDAGSTPEQVNLFTLDSPSTTSAITYTIGLRPDSAGTVYINRTVGDADVGLVERATCEIIAMEVAG